MCPSLPDPPELPCSSSIRILANAFFFLQQMFEPHPLHRRDRAEFTVEFGAYASEYLEVDDDAPWDNAALLAKWSKAGGEEDDSFKKGEVADPNGHHKRSNVTELAKRELDYGLALYCVECGFAGSATIWGELDWGVLDGVTKAQAGFNANFKAGLYLGMQAYVKYEKEWEEKQLARINFGGFSIPFLASVGPFVSLSVEAKAGISATGTLLIGAAVAWDDIDILLDVINTGNSHVNGLTPRFEHKAEATGELKIEASIGLPVRLGVGLELFSGLWTASAAIKDTPSINAEGSFEVSATVTDDGKIEHDINGGCYGIAWNIHFENTLQAVLEAKAIGSREFDLIEPMESDPIAEGCIGYVNDGTDDDATGDSQGIGSGTGTTGNGLNTGANGLSGGKGSGSGSGGSSSSSSTSTSSTTTIRSSTSTSTSTTSLSTSSMSTSKVSTSSAAASTTSSSSKTSSSSASSTSKSSSSSPASSTSKSSSSSSASLTSKSSSSSSTTLSTTASASKTTSKAGSTTATTTATTKPACTPSQVIANPTVPAGLTCKKIVAQASVVASFNVGTAATVNTADLCAANCLKETKCVSFSYNDKKACQMYNKAVKSVAVTTKAGQPQLTFYDKQCYAYSTCPK